MGGSASVGLAAARRVAEAAIGGRWEAETPAQARRYIRAMEREGYTVTDRRVRRLARQ